MVIRHHLMELLLDPPPGNPAPQAPPQVDGPTQKILGWLKWSVLLIIIMSGFVGVGAIAGGRLAGHHGASKMGITILLTSLVSAVLFVAIYAIITAIAG